MAKKLLSVFALCLFYFTSIAQLPPPCPSNTTPPSDFCNQTCIYCNFNGIQSSTAGYSGQTPSGFCGTIENEQWLGFIAGEVGATFTAIPTNCDNGDGIQIALYSGCSGSPLGCNGGSGGGGTNPTSISVANMVPGQNYFLMIDGFAGDQCNFTIVASPPSAITPPIPQAPTMINGPTQVCTNGEFEYCVDPIPGAGAYTWNAPADALVNGMPPPATILGNVAGACVTITFASGSGVICVNGANSCFTGPPACQPVINTPIPPTFLADTIICAEDVPYLTPWGDAVNQSGLQSTILATAANCDSAVNQLVFIKPPIPTVLPPTPLCPQESMTVCGVTYNMPGTYTEVCPAADGCDSSVTFIIIPKVLIPTIIPPTTLCPGESIPVCGSNYSDEGNFTVLCAGSTGCDSTIIFTIITPQITASIIGQPNINCNSTSTTLTYQPSPGTPSWFNGSTLAGNDTALVVTTPGTYILQLEQTLGLGSCSAYDTIVVVGNSDPPALTPVGGTVGCGTSTSISVNTAVANPTFAWSPGTTPSNTSMVTVSSPGDYVVTVTDPSNGCTNTATATVQGSTDIPPLVLSGNNLNCSITSSTIAASTTASGVTYLWSTSDTTPSITTATPGTYTVTVTDPANSCTNEESYVVLSNTTSPVVSASLGGVLTCTTTMTPITTMADSTNLTYVWSNADTTPDITVGAAGTYTVTATASNGCTSTATSTITEDIAAPGVTSNSGTLTCDVSSIALVANSPTAGVSYDWGGTNNNATYQVGTPGAYTVTVTAANGCTSIATGTIDTDQVAPTATATGGTLTCSVSNISLSGNSNTPGVNYVWTGPAGGIFNEQNPMVSGTGDYTLVVTNPVNGCTGEDMATVIPDAGIPDAVASGGTLDCNNTSVQLTSSSSTPGVTMAWTAPDGSTISDPNPMVSVDGDYTLIVTDPANGCQNQAPTTVLLDIAQPIFTLSGGQLSCSQTTLQVQLIPDAGQGTLTYDWTGAGGLSSTDQNPNVSQPGDYTVIVTAENGCTNTDLVSVTADTNIPVAATLGGTVDCNVPTVVLQLDITATGTITSTTWTGPNGFNSNDEDPTAGDVGVYTVTVTTNNGCSSTATAEIIEDRIQPDLLANGGVIGCAAPNTDLEATSTDAIDYLWTGPNGFSSPMANPNVAENGQYIIVVTGANGCTNTEIVSVSTDFDSAMVSIAAPITLDCNNQTISLDASIVSNVVNVTAIEWSDSNGYSNTNEDPDDIVMPGTYTLLVTTENGCTAIETVSVDQDISLPDASAIGNEITCVVTQNVLTGNSTTAGVQYQWESPSGMFINEQSPTVDVPGTYTLQVTGPNGCINTTTADMILNGDFPENVAIAAPVSTIDCNNTAVELSASSTTSGVTFEWFDENGQSLGATDMVLVDQDGTYNVQVTDPSNGCVTPGEQIIDINVTPPDAAATGGTLDCISGQIQLQGTTNVLNGTFAWVDDNGNIYTGDNPTVTNVSDYTLTVQDMDNGCENTAVTSVFENTDSPDVVLSPTDILDCATSQVTLTATINSPANATFEWQNSSGMTVGNDVTLMVGTGDTYTFIVTDPANGCISQPAAVVGEDYVEPGVSTDNALINCATPAIQIDANSLTSGVLYTWTDPNGTSFVGQLQMADTPGDYIVTATGTNGCTSVATAAISEDFVSPDIDVTTETITCITPSVVLNAESGVANLEYAWSNGLPSEEDPTVDQSANYALVVTNPVNGCTNSFDILVPENTTLPGASAVGDTLTCDLTSIPILATSPTAGVSFAWYLDGNLISNDPMPSVTEATDYTVIVTDPANGCTSEATTTVIPDENAPQVAAQGGLINCMTPSIDLGGSSATSNVEFIWSGPNGFTSTETQPNVDATGTYTLVVNSLDNGCTSAATAEVVGNFDAPSLTVLPPDEIDCNNASIIISSNGMGQGNISYDWSVITGQILSGNTAQNPEVGAGVYTVVITDSENGCTSMEDVTVEADPATPSGALTTIRDISCFGETDGAVIIQDIVGGTPPFMYSFDGGVFAAQTQWTFLEPGSYDITVQDVLGCEWSTTYNVVEPEELMIDLGPDLVNLDAGPDQVLFLGDSVDIAGDMTINFPDRVEQYIVSPEEMYQYICDTCQGTFWQAFYTQRYEVTIIDSNGCKAVDDRLMVVDRTRNVYVPNVFNPLSTDGINHLLTVYGNLKHVKGIKSFKLYDRWGEAVYERFDFAANDVDGAWDGTYQGKRVNPAVFVWVAEVEFIDGVTELYKGDVAVIGN